MKKSIAVIIGLVFLFFAFYGMRAMMDEADNYDFFWSTIHQLQKENSNCFQAKDCQYMKHYRQAIRNLIAKGKYEVTGKFPVQSSSGTYDLRWYDIGGYIFQADGTLVGAKDKQNYSERSHNARQSL